MLKIEAKKKTQQYYIIQKKILNEKKVKKAQKIQLKKLYEAKKFNCGTLLNDAQ